MKDSLVTGVAHVFCGTQRASFPDWDLSSFTNTPSNKTPIILLDLAFCRHSSTLFCFGGHVLSLSTPLSRFPLIYDTKLINVDVIKLKKLSCLRCIGNIHLEWHDERKL